MYRLNHKIDEVMVVIMSNSVIKRKMSNETETTVLLLINIYHI
jgi:hypothetical protein